MMYRCQRHCHLHFFLWRSFIRDFLHKHTQRCFIFKMNLWGNKYGFKLLFSLMVATDICHFILAFLRSNKCMYGISIRARFSGRFFNFGWPQCRWYIQSYSHLSNDDVLSAMHFQNIMSQCINCESPFNSLHGWKTL